MAIITRKTGEKRYSYAISTGKKSYDGKYEYIYGPYFATRKEAKDAEILAKAEIKRGVYIAPSKITVNELLDTFIKSKIDLKPSTITALRSFARKAANHYIGQMQISKVTMLDVEAFRTYLFDKSRLSQQTIRETLSFITSAFSWAVDGDLIAKNPARRIKLPPKQASKGLHVPIEILIHILWLIKNFDYANLYMPFLLSGMCGMRISETLALKNDILNGSNISIEHNLLRVNGTLELVSTKTATSVRKIPITDFMRKELSQYIDFIEQCRIKALQDYVALSANTKFIAAGSDEPWNNTKNLLIVFPADGRPMSKDHVERRWRRFKSLCPGWLELVNKYPLLANMRHHDFRHSFGSNLRDRGVQLADISDLLGHTSVSFTAKTYALPLEDTHKKAMQKYENSIKDLLY